MLGIVFAGGKAPPPEIIRAALAGCAKDTLTAAADSGLAAVCGAGLRPDWVVGDMDSVDAALLETFPAGRVIRHSADKDFTDTELACDLLREKGAGEIWIAGGGGGRIDHLFAIRSLFERDPFPSRWISDTADIYCIASGAARETFNRRLERGSLVSVFPLGAGPWRAASRGLKWPLENLPWSRGFFGLSNVAQNEEIMIHSLQGRFMVIVPFAPA